MRKNLIQNLAVNVFTVAMLLAIPTIVDAQVGEARGSNWVNANKLYTLIVKAIEEDDRKETYNLLDEFSENLKKIGDKLSKAGDKAHDKDKKRLKNMAKGSREDLLDIFDKAGKMKEKIEDSSKYKPKSDLSKLKSNWESFKKSFAKMYSNYDDIGMHLNESLKEMEKRLKMFRKECKDCKS